MSDRLFIQIESLTGREQEVLDQLALGHSNIEIAVSLFIAEKTVKRHLATIFGKLDVSNRTEAVLKAQSLGLIRDAEGLTSLEHILLMVLQTEPDALTNLIKRKLVHVEPY